jgi:hypothetical protein
VGIPTAMISAVYDLALSSGANRVVRGVRIEHVVGDPGRGAEKGYARGLQIVRSAVAALATDVDGPSLFAGDGTGALDGAASGAAKTDGAPGGQDGAP